MIEMIQHVINELLLEAKHERNTDLLAGIWNESHEVLVHSNHLLVRFWGISSRYRTYLTKDYLEALLHQR